MKNHSIAAAIRRSAALFTNIGHRRFPRRRFAGRSASPLSFCFLLSVFRFRASGQSYWLGLATAVIGALWPAAPVEAQSPHLAIQLAGSQQLSLDLNGMAGEMYEFDVSSNLVDWAVLLTTNSVTSDVMVTTTEAGSAGEFYRAVDLGPVGGSSAAVFTLLWPGPSGSSGPSPQDVTLAGSVVFVVENATGKTVTNQVVNLLSNTNKATIDWSLANGSYTAVADVFPQPNGVGVPFKEARFSFTITGGAPVAQTFTLAANTITNLILTPLNPIVATAGTLQLNATAFDASNEVVFVASQSGAWTWSSVDTTVATVDYTGKVTGVGPAYATTMIVVTDTADPAITTNVTITVSNEIYGLAITPSPFAFVGVGEETNLTASATNATGDKVPLAASALTWTSSSPTNAIVDPTGLLIGVSPGLATITLTVKNVGVMATITANVSIGGPGNVGDGVPPPTKGYIITDLGTLPPEISSLPSGINDYGHVAGATWDSLSPVNDTPNSGTTGINTPEAIIWKTSLNGVMTVLPDLGGGQAEAQSINNSDEVIGESIKPVTVSSPTQHFHAVLWKSVSKVQDLTGDITDPTLGNPPNTSDAFRINDDGRVIGNAAYTSTSQPSWANAFLLDLRQTNVTYLWTSLPFPQAEAINDAGEMAGGLFLFNGVSAGYADAFVGNVSQVIGNEELTLGNLPGCQSGITTSINNLEQAAGLCSEAFSTVPQFIQPRAVVWLDGQANLDGTGQATDLGTNGYYSRALCINDLGTVVGDSWSSVGNEYTDSHAVLWQGTNLFDLNAYIPTNSGWVLDLASGINNKGQIVGQGTRTNEPGYRSFLLTPNN